MKTKYFKKNISPMNFGIPINHNYIDPYKRHFLIQCCKNAVIFPTPDVPI